MGGKNMCGIGAVWVRRNKDAISKAIALMRGHEHRGRSGTGLAWIQDSEIIIHKELVSPSEFSFAGPQTGLVLCHNRMPSIGEINLRNTHPFLSCDKTIALVHNGTFIEHKLLRTVLTNHEFEGETDSETLVHFIEEFKDRTGLPKLLGSLRGQNVLLLMKDGQVWGSGELFIVNDENGVYISNDEDGLVPVGSGRKMVYEIGNGTVVNLNRGSLTFHGPYTKERRTIPGRIFEEDEEIFEEDEERESYQSRIGNLDWYLNKIGGKLTWRRKS